MSLVIGLSDEDDGRRLLRALKVSDCHLGAQAHESPGDGGREAVGVQLSNDSMPGQWDGSFR